VARKNEVSSEELGETQMRRKMKYPQEAVY